MFNMLSYDSKGKNEAIFVEQNEYYLLASYHYVMIALIDGRV